MANFVANLMRRPWSVEWATEHRRRFLFRFGRQPVPPREEDVEAGESAV